jgi:hypothetical protein
MSSTNRDASVTTRNRGALTTFFWRQQNNYPGNALPGKPEQQRNSAFEGPTATVPLEARVGAQLVGQQIPAAGCACTPNVTAQGYDKKAPGC